jgi:hypothetical protein
MQKITCPECAGSGLIYAMGVSRAQCPTCKGDKTILGEITIAEAASAPKENTKHNALVSVCLPHTMGCEVSAPDSDPGKLKSGRPRGRPKKVR